MKVGLFQYDISWEAKAKNKDKIMKIIERDLKSKIDWLIFPEMTLTGFSMDTDKTTLLNEDIEFFQTLSKKLNAYISFGGVKDKKNKAITIDPKGNFVSSYAKSHLFSYAKEDVYYVAGTSPELFEIMGMKVLPSICYDLRFSNMFWNKAKDTDIIFVMANWPSSRREHWINLLRSRAIENQTFVIGVNRIGTSPSLDYSGDSLLFGPFGDEKLNCSNREGVSIVDISKEELDSVRKEYPFLKDRK